MFTRIREIIEKYVNNNYSERVQKEFISWLKDPADEVDKDSAMKDIWNRLTVQADQSTEESYKQLRNVIQSSVPAIVPERKTGLFVHTRLLVAAILLLPLISAGVTYVLMKSPAAGNERIDLVECIVPNGEIRTIVLPDSSVVKINSGSTLIYPRRFTGSRDIFLSGEAYFFVTKNETMPFVVKTTDMDIEVLGTVFCISSYTDNESSSTTLESGKVTVKIKNTPGEPVALLPNEQVTYHRASGAITKENVKIEHVIAWTSGNLVVQRLSMDEIVKVIERKYAMKVYLNSTNYRNELITIKITNNETVSEFMSILKQLVPQLKYRIEEEKLFIY